MSFNIFLLHSKVKRTYLKLGNWQWKWWIFLLWHCIHRYYVMHQPTVPQQWNLPGAKWRQWVCVSLYSRIYWQAMWNRSDKFDVLSVYPIQCFCNTSNSLVVILLVCCLYICVDNVYMYAEFDVGSPVSNIHGSPKWYATMWLPFVSLYNLSF